MKRDKKYWIIVASKDHVKNGKEQSIAQTCHGKAAPLKRMQKNDGVIFYSSKYKIDKPDKCQEFTAIGKVADEDIYQFQMDETFCPFRRKIEFHKSVDVPIKPLINDLQFIQNKKSWGYPFRFGFFEINNKDYKLISSQMMVEK